MRVKCLIVLPVLRDNFTTPPESIIPVYKYRNKVKFKADPSKIPELINDRKVIRLEFSSIQNSEIFQSVEELEF